MILDNSLISNRPKQLERNDYYTQLPRLPISFDYASIPEYLNIDLFTLIGIMPKTVDLVQNTQFGFIPQPSQKEIEYYKQKKTKFQMINVVANIHTFKNFNNEYALAYPYSISLIVSCKRGLPDSRSIDYLSSLDLEKISNTPMVYTDYLPFKPIETGLFGHVSLLMSENLHYYTDTVGLVLETYFLPTDISASDEIPMYGPQNLDTLTNEKYNKYRIKRYFKPFEDVKPRKIWGCDSPIELFLIQALAQRNLFPKIQTLVFKNGHVYDNFYEMIKKQIFIKGDELITEVDLYFPDIKLAVFCDSTKFHRGGKNKIKDELIDKELNNIGIKSIRLTGNEIIEQLDSCVEKIITKISHS